MPYFTPIVPHPSVLPPFSHCSILTCVNRYGYVVPGKEDKVELDPEIEEIAAGRSAAGKAILEEAEDEGGEEEEGDEGDEVRGGEDEDEVRRDRTDGRTRTLEHCFHT